MLHLQSSICARYVLPAILDLCSLCCACNPRSVLDMLHLWPSICARYVVPEILDLCLICCTYDSNFLRFIFDNMFHWHMPLCQLFIIIFLIFIVTAELVIFVVVVVVLGSSIIAKNLALLDSKYNSIFNDSTWKDNIIDKCDTSNRFSQSMGLQLYYSLLARTVAYYYMFFIQCCTVYYPYITPYKLSHI